LPGRLGITFDVSAIVDAVAVNVPKRSSIDPEVRDALRAYFDAIVLADPVQAVLWKSAGITLAQLAALRQLRDGPVSAGQLGRQIGLSPASTTHLVDRLEARDLVARSRRQDDRRAVDVRLTPAGRQVLDESRPLPGSLVHRAIEAMPSGRRRELTGALVRLIEQARALPPAEEVQR
jgi:MarR family transcriptional regulator, organic hydroperoxide resistance regulator